MSIICEIGQNFVGDLELAKKLILLAKENGGDFAKFQLYDTDKLYTPDTELYRLAKESELTREQAQMLFSYGESIGIEVFFSVFDVERVAWCEEIGVDHYKVAYSQRHNNKLRSRLVNTGASRIYVSGDNLYCIPHYPTNPDELDFMEVDFVCEWDGYSDHTIGIDCARIALARGAKIIEKHFCISHNVGVDGKWSMTPKELRELKRWENVISQVL